MKKKCPNCFRYIDIKDWPVYNGKEYGYCRDCKREIQRIWIQNRRERIKYENSICTKKKT